MQKLITKYGLAAHLAITAVAPLFLSPVAALWLAALAAAWLVMEPSRIGDEMLHGARARVATAIARDPLFWVLVALVAISGVRALNCGIEMSYDAETSKWFLSEPPMPVMPASVDGAGLPVFSLAVVSLVVLEGCRHALGRSARYAFMLVASALSGLGAVVFAMMMREGMGGMAEMSACALVEPSYAGSAFGVYFSASVVALEAAFERRWLKAMPFAALAVLGNAAGLFLFAPAIVVAIFAGAALVVFLYSFLFLRAKLGDSAEFKYLVVFGISLVLGGMLVMGLAPQSLVDARAEPFVTGAFLPEEFFPVRSALSAISYNVWKDGPWLGSGLGTFPFDLRFAATPSDWAVVSPLQKAPLNGYWLLLVERGVIGAFLLAVPFALMVVTYVRRLALGVAVSFPHPLCWIGVVLVAAAGAETLGDASFLSPGAMIALAAVFSLSANAFPKEKRKNG